MRFFIKLSAGWRWTGRAYHPHLINILTTENDDQAAARMAQKGADCAAVAIEMANLLRELERK